MLEKKINEQIFIAGISTTKMFIPLGSCVIQGDETGIINTASLH